MARPLKNAKNLGPVSVSEFARLGVHTWEHLCELGWREACLMWAERFPARINLNAFRSVIGAVYDVAWNEISDSELQEARQMVQKLRRQSQDERG